MNPGHFLISLLTSLTTFTGASPLPPESFLPFELSVFTKTVASVQNAYCGSAFNYEGLTIDDQTLQKSISLGSGYEQRINIYTSDSLGIIVAFEGTNTTNFDSIIHDVDALKVRPDTALGISSDAMIFAGWQDQFQKSWDDVKTSLQNVLLQNPGTKVQVIGHSQGTAICQLAALAIYHEFGDVIERIIGYGPPRVGDANYASYFDSIFKGKYVGVVNGKDWVPSVPPQILGFRHPSGLIWINPANSTNYYYFPDSEDPNGPDSITPPLFTSQSIHHYPFLSFGDHQGIYMHSSLGTSGGPCPAKVGGF